MYILCSPPVCHATPAVLTKPLKTLRSHCWSRPCFLSKNHRVQASQILSGRLQIPTLHRLLTGLPCSCALIGRSSSQTCRKPNTMSKTTTSKYKKNHFIKNKAKNMKTWCYLTSTRLPTNQSHRMQFEALAGTIVQVAAPLWQQSRSPGIEFEHFERSHGHSEIRSIRSLRHHIVHRTSYIVPQPFNCFKIRHVGCWENVRPAAILWTFWHCKSGFIHSMHSWHEWMNQELDSMTFIPWSLNAESRWWEPTTLLVSVQHHR